MKIEFDFATVEAELASAENACIEAWAASRATAKAWRLAIDHACDVKLEPTSTFGSAAEKVAAEKAADLKCDETQAAAVAAVNAHGVAETRRVLARAALSARNGIRANYKHATGHVSIEVDI